MQTVTVKLNPRDFNTGLRYAKKVGGKYNPADKTWDIPASRVELNAPASYGWIVISSKPASRTPEWGEDSEDNVQYWLNQQKGR